MIFSNKAQGSVEFIILFGFVLLFFVIFAATILEQNDNRNSERQILLLQNVALNVQDEINIAAEASNGYYRTFNVPDNVFGKDYEINITEGQVWVALEDAKFAYRIFNITGEIKKGDNLIKKENGKVYLN